jgi:hypothetical protein
MRTSLLSLAILTFAVVPASAQTVVNEGQPNWATKLFPDKTLTHDFGNVPHGTLLHYKFKLHNIYAVPLEIHTRVGCSCLTATSSVDVLKPNEDAVIDVTMNTAVYTGPRTKPIHVDVGPQYISSATLWLSANSRADIVCNPNQVNFGVIARRDAARTQTIDVEYAGARDWRITGVANSDAPLDVTYKELYRRPGEQVGYRVTVALKPGASAGALREDLMLKTNDPNSPVVPVHVEATVQADLTVAPEIINLGKIKAGESLTKLVYVRGASPFHVVTVEGQGDGVVAEAPTAAAQVQIIKIKYEAGKSGEFKKQLKIKTDLGREEPLIVTLQGTIEP